MLHEWQAECLNIWTRNGCRGIVNAVTGSGKTVMALSAIERLETMLDRELRVKIVVPQTFLATQWKDEIKCRLVANTSDIGLYCAERKDSGRKYMIYVVNSARYSLARHILSEIKAGYGVLLIADECHHYGSAENSRIFDFYRVLDKDAPYYALGLSATPEIADFRRISIPLGDEIYSYDLGRALQDSVISRFILFSIRLSFTPYEHAEYIELSENMSVNMVMLKRKCPELKDMPSGIFFAYLQKLAHQDSETAQLARMALTLMYQRRSLCHMAKERSACAVSIINEIPVNSKVILFCERIKAAQSLFRRLSERYPNQAGLYHSKMHDNTRQDILSRFKYGEIRLLICCKALDEGLDIPSTDVGIIVSSSMSARQRVQRLGRMLRRSKDVKRIYYLYIGESNEDCELVYGLRTIENSVPFIALNYFQEAFIHPEYERLRKEVLDYISRRKKDPALHNAINKNLDQALLRGDFLVSESACRENLRLSKTVTERNYWTSVLYFIHARSGFLR
jgi:superfamily II DNA or RNA helicase